MEVTERATVVLVHGLGAGAWIWEPLIQELRARDVEACAVDLPTVGEDTDPSFDFHTDAAHLRSVVENMNGPLVLCSNSYGGLVITEASAGHPNVMRLVYMAAFMPDADEDVLSLLASACTPETLPQVIFRDDGLIDLDRELVNRLAFQQASAETAAWAVSKLRPVAMGAGGMPTVSGVGWQTIPSTYIICGRDKSIQPAVQRKWAENRATTFIEVPFDHCPQVSHPAEIADLLAEVAGDSRPQDAE